LVLECTRKEQTLKQFAERIRMVWEQWLDESQQTTVPGEAEFVRKERLTALRLEFLDSLGAETVTQIMRAEAARYNYIRSK